MRKSKLLSQLSFFYYVKNGNNPHIVWSDVECFHTYKNRQEFCLFCA